MDTIKIKMKMTNPTDTHDFWDNIYALGKVLAPWGTVGWVCHKLINSVFKYFSDRRDEQLRALIKKETQPQLDELSEKLDHLGNMIFELKNKMQ